MNVQEKIKNIINDHKVVLFMKGSKDFPQCGFSSRVAQILRENNTDFLAVNVLEDPELRQGIKDFANWPTIPQLYINGEFIGGCDIVTELHQNGELQKMLQS